jgi:hypothetical protein
MEPSPYPYPEHWLDVGMGIEMFEVERPMKYQTVKGKGTNAVDEEGMSAIRYMLKVE